jgi:hypothetical protein
MKHICKIALLLIVSVYTISIQAQERDWEKMLTQTVEIANPVYMPVVGVGMGYLNFFGDLKNNGSNPLMGSLAIKANVHAFIDQGKHYKFNLYVMLTMPGATPLTVNQRNYSVPAQNFNFASDMYMIGLNGHYDFDHFIKKTAPIRPYISVGGELLSFSSKSDKFGYYYDSKGIKHDKVAYNYWTDGTIRNVPQSDERQSYLMERDNVFETDLRSDSSNTETYSQNIFAIPLEFGVDFTVSNRTNVRLGYAYHYTFSKYIDNIKNASGSDAIGYTYISLHFDLFSDPKVKQQQLLLAMIDEEGFDNMYDDEDGDGVRDVIDLCPRTPNDVPVDTAGCPFDGDQDRVPDYMDKDKNTLPGAIVGRDGIEIPDAQVWDVLNQEALPRDQVEMYISIMNSLAAGSGRKNGSVEIPEKFLSLDADKDGYISFDEVLKTIDAFFDFDTDLSTQDIYELNDFFFAQ